MSRLKKFEKMRTLENEVMSPPLSDGGNIASLPLGTDIIYNENNRESIDRMMRDVGVDPSLVPMGSTVNFHVGFIRNNKREIEYTKALPSVKSHKGAEHLQDFTAAVPAKITPSRTKAKNQKHKDIFVFSDQQVDYRRIDLGDDNLSLVPIHDERAMRVARELCSFIKPNVIVNCGDTPDLASLSRFKPDSDHFYRSSTPTFQRIHNYYGELRADNPTAKIVETDSNHVKRFDAAVLKNMPQFYNVRAAGSDSRYPFMSYPYLVGLEKVDVEWVSGYSAAEYKYAEDLVFIHGTLAVSNGSTAEKLSKNNPDRNIVQGHKHNSEMFTKTDRNGRQYVAAVVGALCSTHGLVPSYHSSVDSNARPVYRQENWAQSVMHIEDYGNGNYIFNHIPIIRGVAHYRGKTFIAQGTDVEKAVKLQEAAFGCAI